MTVINTNVKALYSQNQLKVNGREMTHAMQALSTGKRINSSADDAAGLAISDRMSQQISSLTMAVRNGGDAISLIQTAEGATSEIAAMLQRMRELALQAINDTNTTEQRGYLDIEFQQLKEEITRVAEMTEWNSFPVLSGDAGVRVGEQPIYKAVSDGDHNQVFINPTTTRPVSGAGSSEIQKIAISGTPSTGIVTVGGVDVTITASESSAALAATKIKETLEASTAFGTGSGRTVTVDSTNITITYAPTEGNVSDITFATGATNLSGAVTTPRPPVTSVSEAFSTSTGKFKKSGTLSISIPASSSGSNATLSATFTDQRGNTTTMTGTVNRTNSTMVFAATGNNADIISDQLTYTFNGSDGNHIGTTAHQGLDDWDGVGDGSGTDAGRAVSVDIAVQGGLSALNVGDLVINGHVIPASSGTNDTLSPINNSAGSAIAIAAAINSQYSNTNVKAIVNENSMRGQAMSSGSQITGVVFVNGVASDEIKTVPGNVRETRIATVDAINRVSSKTGVVAVDTGSDAKGVLLKAKDGRNIEVTFETTASVIDFGKRTGLREGVQGGTYSLESKVETSVVLTSNTGNISNSGLSLGDFTTNETAVKTKDRAIVEAPLPQVDKVSLGDAVVNSSTYTVTINGTSFTQTASGTNEETVRDALVTAINNDLTLGVTASKGDAQGELNLTGSSEGGSFLVAVSGSGTITTSSVQKPEPAQYKTLQKGDLKINGIEIPAAKASDDSFSNTTTSSSKREASAISLAAAINSVSTQTGVSARVNATETKGTSTDTTINVSGTQSIYVNNVKIDVNLVKDETASARRTKVIDAVNARNGQHGVTATDNGSGVTLTAADGRNMSVYFDSNVSNLSAASFGLEKGGSVAQTTRVSFGGTVDDDTASITINGVTVTSAAATGDTAADLANKLQTAIAADANVKNTTISYTGGNTFFELTSSVLGSPMTVTGATTSNATSTMKINPVTKNSTGTNDVVGIINATATSSSAKTIYGTVDLLSKVQTAFSITPGKSGYLTSSNFAAIGFKEGDYGGKSSEEMSPPKVGRLSFQVGQDSGQVINIDLPDFGYKGPITSQLTSDVKETTKTIKISNRTSAETALVLCDNVQDLVNKNRAGMGAVMNRLNYAIDTLTNVNVNSVQSRSRILDADYAAMSTELARTQIIQQAATAVLAQANADQQTVLRLLQ